MAAAFRFDGSNNYAVRVYAYSEPLGEGERIFVSATRKGSAAFYSAPVRMTATTINADLGSLGKVDLSLNPSGREKTIRLRCSRGATFTYEPGVYEGVLEFKGEEGYTTVSATQVPLRPLIEPSTFCGGGSGSGEARGPGVPGARLRGVSYADGRALSLQVTRTGRGESSSSKLPLAGPTVHVSLVHARFNCSDNGEAEIHSRPRCGF